MEITRAAGGWQGNIGISAALGTGLVVLLVTTTVRVTWGQSISDAAAVIGESEVGVDPPPWNPDGQDVDGEVPGGSPQLPFPLQFVPRTDFRPPGAEAERHGPHLTPANANSGRLALTPRRPSAEVLPTRRGSRNSGPTSTTAISSLCLVLGVFFAFAWLARRSGRSRRHGPPPEVLRHLGFFTLGHRRQVELVRFGGKLLILNTTQNNVEKIAELDDPEEVERLTADCLSPHRSRSHAAVRELVTGTRSTAQVTDSGGQPRYQVPAGDALPKK